MALLGNTTGALLGYGAGRLLGSDALDLLGARNRHVRVLTTRLVHRPFSTMLGLRLTPGMPFAAVSLAAGSNRLPVAGFAWATALGTAPGTAACVAAGTAAASPLSLAVWGPFAGALAVLGAAFLIRRRRRSTAP
ncbi:VTT domain-containing protein [Streptomyces echinatus]|uniref:TVP38/TMEM64 family membrane protein n=1 Tax=Streptomyces echinatus TaxID=67293 RepID=A0A7W9PRU9_9ACTN|nr:VTT domain-containing protein [Streptomyces echinatus]MBB5926646.1 putative membrane protein YdjX (TVP38/TMEM64 family) [Streptomyces echinatus]